MHVKKGDTVYVTTGSDKGKSGKVLRAFPKLGRVLVEGINTKKVHERARKSGEKGKVVEKNFPIHASNVQVKEKADKPAKKAK